MLQALSIIPKSYCKPLFLVHNDVSAHILFLAGDDAVRRILSLPMEGAKKLWTRFRSLPGGVDRPVSPPAVATTSVFVVAVREYLELPPRYVGVLFKDPLPEFHLDDRPEQLQLKRRLNALLDAYHELQSPAVLPKTDQGSELLPAELDEDERIEQVAARFLEAHDWPLTALPLVMEVFHHLGWSATRVALDTAMENGMSVRELELAFHLKVIWEGSDKYSQQSRWKNMPWPTALQIIRSFAAYPQKYEIESFIERLHDRWLNTPPAYRYSQFFLSYILKCCATQVTDCVTEHSRLLAHFDEIPFNNHSRPESYDIANVQLQQRLLELGVI